MTALAKYWKKKQTQDKIKRENGRKFGKGGSTRPRSPLTDITETSQDTDITDTSQDTDCNTLSNPKIRDFLDMTEDTHCITINNPKATKRQKTLQFNQNSEATKKQIYQEQQSSLPACLKLANATKKFRKLYKNNKSLTGRSSNQKKANIKLKYMLKAAKKKNRIVRSKLKSMNHQKLKLSNNLLGVIKQLSLKILLSKDNKLKSTEMKELNNFLSLIKSAMPCTKKRTWRKPNKKQSTIETYKRKAIREIEAVIDKYSENDPERKKEIYLKLAKRNIHDFDPKFDVAETLQLMADVGIQPKTLDKLQPKIKEKLTWSIFASHDKISKLYQSFVLSSSRITQIVLDRSKTSKEWKSGSKTTDDSNSVLYL